MSDEDRSREAIDKIDQEVEALVKAPDRSLGPLNARPPGVSAPIEASGVNHLAMNAVIPGLGSLVRGNKGPGAGQLGLAVGGLLLILSGHFAFGLLLGFAGWLWSVISGFGFLKDRKSAW